MASPFVSGLRTRIGNEFAKLISWISGSDKSICLINKQLSVKYIIMIRKTAEQEILN